MSSQHSPATTFQSLPREVVIQILEMGLLWDLPYMEEDEMVRELLKLDKISAGVAECIVGPLEELLKRDLSEAHHHQPGSVEHQASQHFQEYGRETLQKLEAMFERLDAPAPAASPPRPNRRTRARPTRVSKRRSQGKATMTTRSKGRTG